MEQISSFIKNGQIYSDNGMEMIKFDCGMTLYTGPIDKSKFPEEFQSNYLDVIKKSFTGYKDSSFEISGGFEHPNFSPDNKFIIKIIMKTAFYNFEKIVSFDLAITKKDRVDYLAERVGSLETIITQLQNEISELKFSKTSSSTKKMEKIEESESSDSSESEEEQSATKKKIVQVRQKKTTSTSRK